MVRTILGIGVLAAGIASLLAGVEASAAPINLASYRAVYDLVLDRSRETPDLAELSGRIVMEFSGSDCGYSVNLRFVTAMADPEGTSRITDARSESFETDDGKTFTFTNQTFVDQSLAEESRGKAEETGSGVSVVLTKPAPETVQFGPSVAFPTEQVEEIIAAARKGRHFLQMDVFDGSEDGKTVYATAVVIGEASQTQQDVGEETAAQEAGVAGLRHWPVTVSYFDRKDTADPTPVYVMSFILYENGISRDLRISYETFAIVGRLSQLEMLPAATACPEPGASAPALNGKP